LTPGFLAGVEQSFEGRACHPEQPAGARLLVVLVVVPLRGRAGSTPVLFASPFPSASPFLSRLLKRLLDLVLHLLTQRLQRLVYLTLDLFAGQLERLLHLLTDGLGDLPLQLSKHRLHRLADLLLQCLPQILIGLARCSSIVVLVGPTVPALGALALSCATVPVPGVGLSGAPVPLVATLTVVGPRLPIARLASRLILVVRLPRSSCLLNSHLASLLHGALGWCS
jgi:hypothetical protein